LFVCLFFPFRPSRLVSHIFEKKNELILAVVVVDVRARTRRLAAKSPRGFDYSTTRLHLLSSARVFEVQRVKNMREKKNAFASFILRSASLSLSLSLLEKEREKEAEREKETSSHARAGERERKREKEWKGEKRPECREETTARYL